MAVLGCVGQSESSQSGNAWMHRLDWTDLQHALAVAETGSLAGAARALGVNHTTVLRRLNGLEGRIGVRLFERLPAGYALTTAGEEVLGVARGLGATVATLERRLLGRDLRLSGTLRVATTDTLALTILMPHLAAFRAAHPGIELEVTLSNAMANLTRRDGEELLAIAPRVPVHTHVTSYSLADTNAALDDLRHGRFQGAAVVVPGHGEVTDVSLIRDVRGYLDYVRSEASRLRACGASADDTAAAIEQGVSPGWTLRLRSGDLVRPALQVLAYSFGLRFQGECCGFQL